MIALVVTLACLPLLVIDMFQRSPSSGASQTASSTDPSLVVASVSTEDSTTTTVAVTVPDTVPVTVPAPVTTVAPPTTVAPRRAPTTTTTQRRATTPPVPTGNAPDSPNQWDRLADCETGGNWAANSGNGYGGGLQFAHGPRWSTWRAFGGEEFTAHPWEATREQQIVIAERVLASSGWGAWPGCMSR